MALSQAAAMAKGKLYGEDASFSGVGIDSRRIDKNSLFVAIPGERFDGHDFVNDAGTCGASGAMVAELQDSSLSQILVKDTTRALGLLGSQWRSQFELPVAAITGSNGKTTVTAMVASIFRQAGNCLAPEKSFNNQWGMPLTLLNLNADHDFAVIEMGANHPGEIDYLSRLARPTIALINNVSSAHVEGLGSIDEIARAKAEIFAGLGDRGIAVLNADDEFFPFWCGQFSGVVNHGRVVTFGRQGGAEISCTDPKLGISQSCFELKLDSQSVQINLPLPGEHNVMNALAAAAVAHAAGVGPEKIRSGLQAVKGVAGRLEFGRGAGGSKIVDDSYNANPESIKAAINVMGRLPGKKFAVLGIMAELGSSGPGLHYEIGAYALEHGINNLFCYEPGEAGLAQQYAAGFGPGSILFTDISEMIEAVRQRLTEDVVVLVKGSRSSRMERVVAAITVNRKNHTERESKQC
jgi:UDP-N-acetylmuramoyl-tripeptide--D-alanyl-D-alanine ligase